MLARAAAAWRPRAAAASSSSPWLSGVVRRCLSASAPHAALSASPDLAAASSASSSPSSSSGSLAPAPPPPPAYALDEDQRAFQQLAADFARENLLPHTSDWDARSHFPVDVFRKAAELGFGGLFVAEDFGGAALSRLSASVVFEELAAGDVSFSAYLSIHNMVAGVVAKHAASDAARFADVGRGQERRERHEMHQRRRAALLKRLCSMESFAAYCLTEPASGSDAASLSTSARRGACPATGEPGWLLRGGKAFISGAGAADVYLVMARVVGAADGDGHGAGGQGGQGGQATGGRRKDDDDAAQGITAFLVDRRRDGFAPSSLAFGAPEKKMGWKMMPTCAVYLEDAFVPDCDVVGPLGGGFRAVALRALDGGRVNIGAVSVGGASRALGMAARYARSRRQFGARVSDFQATRMRLADAATDVEASRVLVRRAAAALDAAAAAAAAAAGGGCDAGGSGNNTDSAASLDDEASALAAMAKRHASDKCFDAANASLQTFGGYGFLSDYGVEQVVRDLRVHSLLEGTNEVMRLVVAKKLPLFAEAAAADEAG